MCWRYILAHVLPRVIIVHRTHLRPRILCLWTPDQSTVLSADGASPRLCRFALLTRPQCTEHICTRDFVSRDNVYTLDDPVGTPSWRWCWRCTFQSAKLQRSGLSRVAARFFWSVGVHLFFCVSWSYYSTWAVRTSRIIWVIPFLVIEINNRRIWSECLSHPHHQWKKVLINREGD